MNFTHGMKTCKSHIRKITNLLKMETLKLTKPYLIAFFMVVFNFSVVAQNATSETALGTNEETSVQAVTPEEEGEESARF